MANAKTDTEEMKADLSPCHIEVLLQKQLKIYLAVLDRQQPTLEQDV